ncbi:hypothetical protein ACO0SA_001656 [Hanseniaspora valbyensis]
MIDIVNLIFQLQSLLGRERWIKYASILSQFIMGKKTLIEMQQELCSNVLWKTDLAKIYKVLFNDSIESSTTTKTIIKGKTGKKILKKKLKFLHKAKISRDKKMYVNKKIILTHNRLIIALLGNTAEEILVQGKEIKTEKQLEKQKQQQTQQALENNENFEGADQDENARDSDAIKNGTSNGDSENGKFESSKVMKDEPLKGLFTIDNDALDELEQQQKIIRASKTNNDDKKEEKLLLDHKNSGIVFLNKVLDTFSAEDKLRFARIQKEDGKRGFINATNLKNKLDSMLKVPSCKEYMAVNINGHIPGRYVNDSKLIKNNSMQYLYNITKQHQYDIYLKMISPLLAFNKLIERKFIDSYLEDNNLLEYHEQYKANNNTHLKLSDVYFPLDGFLGTTQFSKDIIKAQEQPLCKELYNFPDVRSLTISMTGQIRQLGMIGNVAPGCAELLLVGLQQYLCDIIEEVHDVVKYRRKKYSELYEINEEGNYTAIDIFGNHFKEKIDQDMSDKSEKETILTCDDVLEALEVNPTLIDQSIMPKDLLFEEYIHNDDDIVRGKSCIDDLELFQHQFTRPVSGATKANQIGSKEELLWILKDSLME